MSINLFNSYGSSYLSGFENKQRYQYLKCYIKTMCSIIDCVAKRKKWLSVRLKLNSLSKNISFSSSR